MRKLLTILAVIFIFFCGIKETNAANYSVAANQISRIEAASENTYNADNQLQDKYFISSNISNSFEYIFEGFGTPENNNFNLNNLFLNNKSDKKIYKNTDGYLLSISSNPRAP